MLRRVLKNRPVRQAFKTYDMVSPSFYNQQRFKSLPVFSDKPKLTTETVVKMLESYIGAKENYVSKYPNVTVEQTQAQLREIINRPIYYDETTKDYITSLLGYPKDEVEWILTGKYPSLYEWKGEELHVNWEQVGRMFTRTDLEKGVLADLESAFKKFKGFEEELNNVQDVTIDWDRWETELGKETVSQMRNDMEEAFQRTKAEIDMERLGAAVNSHMQPYVDQVKDMLLDDMPTLTQLTDDLQRESNMLREDESGQPVILYDSPYFLDAFAPQERDEIILEIENDDWDTEYTKEIKATKISPDELVEYNRQWVIESSAEVEEEAMKNFVGEGAASDKEQREQLLFNEVNAAAKRTKQLETEVNQLKTKLEFEAESSAGDKEKEKKSTTSTAATMSKEEWDSFLKKRGVNEETGVARDFKHISPEQIKQWEAKALKERQEAEQILSTIVK